MRLSSFGQGKDAIYDRPKLLFADKLQDGIQLGTAAHIGAKQRELPRKEITQIQLRGRACGGAAGNQAPAGGETQNALVPGGDADVLEDDVHAALGREPPDFFGDFLLRVIDDLVSAKLASFI